MNQHVTNKQFRVFDKQTGKFLDGNPQIYKFVHPDDGELYDVGQFFAQPQRFWVQEKTNTTLVRPDGSLQDVYEGDLVFGPENNAEMVTVHTEVRRTPDFNREYVPGYAEDPNVVLESHKSWPVLNLQPDEVGVIHRES